MKTKKILPAIVLLTLVSCGENKKNSSRNEINPICTENCSNTMDWKISLPGRSFPVKSRVVINDAVVLDECLHKQKYAIDRQSSPESLT